MKFLILITLVLDLVAIYRVTKDETYLFDNDKPKYIFWIVVIPIIGAIVAMRKIGYKGFFMTHMGRSEMLYPKYDEANADKVEHAFDGVDAGGGS